MNAYNAADTRSIRKAQKLARQAEAERDIVVAGLVSTIAGRAYVHDLLVRSHIFSPSFNLSALAMAFAEGERNVGLQILSDIMRCAPDQYVQMMREYNDRSTSDYRRSRASEDTDRGAPGPAVDSSGGNYAVQSEYDPFDDGSEDSAERGEAEGRGGA